MIVLDVFKNGRLQFRAGCVPDGILSVHLMRASHVGEPPRWGVSVDVLEVNVDEVAEWTCEPLFPGDEVTCRVVDAERGDPPNVSLSDSEYASRCEEKGLLQARSVYAGLKKRILEMEEKWGHQL